MSPNEKLRERDIQAAILRVVGARPFVRLWRQNTGKVPTADGKRVIAFGIPGAADLSGLLDDGRRLEIEVKTASGRQSERQRRFMEMIQRFGGVYIIARSPDDALEQLATLGYPRESHQNED